MTGFTDQTAVVTGASSGIGAAIARALGAAGLTVCLIARRRDALNEQVALIQASGGEAEAYPVDLTDDSAVQDFAREVTHCHDRIGVLVHSAGLYTPGRVQDASVSEFDAQHRVGLRAPYVLTQALLPSLIRSQGQVVFMNTSAVAENKTGLSGYVASKAGLLAFADCLRNEVNAAGVRVLSVFAGRTATPMLEAIVEAEGGAYNPKKYIQPEDIAQAVLSALRLPRTAEVTEIRIRPMRK